MCSPKSDFFILKKKNMADGEEDVIIAVGLLLAIKKKRLKKRRRWAVIPHNQGRRERGAYTILVQELGLDNEMFQRYFRCTKKNFAMLLHTIGSDITKRHRSSGVLCPKQRLSICLR